MNSFQVKRALISVYDKNGLVELAKPLSEKGVDIISSGGTSKVLKKAGIKVTEVCDYTGAPEIFGGRVKTLHPRIHGGILMRRDNQDDVKSAEEANILPIDLVVVNLYPFVKRAAEGISEAEAMEEIDIGGVALLRAAAKNYTNVAVLCNPEQYSEFLEHFSKEEGISVAVSRKWAGQAFTHTASYDAAIDGYFAGAGRTFNLRGELQEELRYGENPHQKASWFKTGNQGITAAKKLWGKGLSYVNVQDFDAALNIVRDFEEPACVIIKHTTPSGLAVGKNAVEAYKRAFSCDTRSPFGGIIGFNCEVDIDAAEEMARIFLEGIVAPKFTDEALARLKKKKDLRLIEWAADEDKIPEKKICSVSGGILVQDADNIPISRKDFKVVTRLQPSESQWKALEFGAKTVKWTKSNAVVLCNENQTLGIGCGQTSRVGAVEIAVANAERFELSIKGAVMASDAFFPFPDSVEEAAKFGVRAVVQPGGSVRDKEVIEAADKLGIAMVFTGKRHFRH